MVTPQYPSQQARDDAIEAGAGRPAAVLLADLTESAGAFRAEAARLPDHSWQVSVHGLRGRGHPAWYTLARRLSEVEIHHVDLAAGYRPPDWPGWFVSERLESVAAEFAGRAGVPAARLVATDTGTAAAGAGAAGAGGAAGAAGTAAAAAAGRVPGQVLPGPPPPRVTAGSTGSGCRGPEMPGRRMRPIRPGRGFPGRAGCCWPG